MKRRTINFSGLGFDDVYLHPQASNVNSRTDVDLSRTFGNLTLDVPFIASPMLGIVGTELIIELSKLGGIGILHRFHKSDSDWELDLTKLSKSGENFGVAVKMGDSQDKIRYALDKGAKIVCVDLAHGYMSSLHDYCNKVANIVHHYDVLLMSGNVVCKDGVEKLASSGVDMIRGGIGSGRVCSTTYVTGIGKPQLQAIYDMQNTDSIIVSDGGIRSTGDMVKAIAAGADCVMMGSFFATAFESTNSGTIYGMSSKRLQEDFYTEIRSIEGIELHIEKLAPLAEIIDTWSWNIKSACTYMNARNLNKLQENAIFIKV